MVSEGAQLSSLTEEDQSPPRSSPKRLRVKVFTRPNVGTNKQEEVDLDNSKETVDDNEEPDWQELGTGYLFTGVDETEVMDGPSSDEQRCMHVVSETD
ncbi:MAG: hypothetical protein MHPSP_004208, partial [Paramarteilia canceri]